MTIFNHPINSRTLTAFAPLASELAFDPSKNYLFDLSYLATLSVTGSCAQEFLQGQLSCDLREVNDKQIRQGASCNLKGRVLVLMDIIKWFDQSIHLVLPNDLLVETQTSLAKPALFSKVTVSPETSYRCFGFYLQESKDQTPFDLELPYTRYSVVYHEFGCCYSLGNNYYMLLVKNEQAQTLINVFSERLQYRGSLAWHALQLQQKRMDIYPESRGLFLAHRLDLQTTGYLSFDKGCYKGQEIIARTHYRATLKHELKLLTIQTTEKLASGQTLLSDPEQQAIGELIDYCPIENDTYLIVVSILIGYSSRMRLENHKNSLN